MRYSSRKAQSAQALKFYWSTLDSCGAIEEFIIAGAFGTYINIPSAIYMDVSILPSNVSARWVMLLRWCQADASFDEAEQSAEEIAQRLNYVELSLIQTLRISFQNHSSYKLPTCAQNSQL